MLKSIIVSILCLISFQSVAAAQTYYYYSHSSSRFLLSRYHVSCVSVDTSTITFVNCEGVFDGSTDYAMVDILFEDKTSRTQIPASYLFDLQSPYYKLKNLTIHSQKIDMKSRRIENVNTTFKANDPWEAIDSSSPGGRMYNDVIAYVEQNWQTIYEQSKRKGNSASVNVSAYAGDNNEGVKPAEATPLEVKPQEVSNLTWNGVWATNEGEMKITEEDNGKIEISFKGRKFIAELVKNKVIGKWSGIKFFNSTEPQGDFQFTMAPNGKFITIRWSDINIGWVTDSTAKRL